MTAALADWTAANRANGSNITYVVGAAGAPANPNQINIITSTLFNSDGSVVTDAGARFTANVRRDDGSLRTATIVFNMAATATGAPGALPFYDPNAPTPPAPPRTATTASSVK